MNLTEPQTDHLRHIVNGDVAVYRDGQWNWSSGTDPRPVASTIAALQRRELVGIVGDTVKVTYRGVWAFARATTSQCMRYGEQDRLLAKANQMKAFTR